ncbi:MAG: TlpA family protein disulfide reductase [Thermoflexaceae bacterium]|nr:TlpA family protein disulfide reductase [Thermoflexaceae bacterium]
MGAQLEVAAEPEDTDDEPVPEPVERQVVRKRGGRDPFRDLIIPVAAITAVVVAIVLVQLIRERESTPATAPVFAPGSYSPIELGSQGGGKPKLGEPAPGFQLLDVDGQVVRLDGFRGRPVLINFWATWCVPCRKETPELVELQSEWGDQAQIVGVNYSEPADTARAFATNFGINYVLPLDNTGEVTGSYKLTGLPETFFLDSEGIIRDHRIGQLNPDVARCIVASIQAGNHKPEACR